MLAATSLLVVATAAAIPFTPLGAWFGFVPPPARFFGLLAAMVAAHVVMVEGIKRVFYWRRAAPR